MSTTYDNELRGVSYRNDRKRPDKKDPDYTGKMTVSGVEYWLDSWINEAQDGTKYMAHKLRAKVAKAVQETAPFDDSIPF